MPSNVKKDDDAKPTPELPVLDRAPPPWHTQLVVYALLGSFAAYTPAAIETMDEIATMNTFTRSLFPSIISTNQVIICRFLFAVVLLSVNCYDFFFANLGLLVTYYDGSRCKPSTIIFRGLLNKEGSLRRALMTNTSFSNWSVGLLGLSFLLNGLIPFLSLHFRWEIPKNLLRFAVLIWTMSAPSAFLVSLIVKYVLWPHSLSKGEDTFMFKKPFILISHNANSIAALTEVGLLSGLPCRFKDFAAAPLFGLVYVLFTWFMIPLWTEDYKKYGPQFLYPFMDTTLGSSCTIAVVALFLVFVGSFCLFSLAEHILTEYVGGGIIGHFVAVACLCLSVCRFRD